MLIKAVFEAVSENLYYRISQLEASVSVTAGLMLSAFLSASTKGQFSHKESRKWKKLLFRFYHV